MVVLPYICRIQDMVLTMVVHIGFGGVVSLPMFIYGLNAGWHTEASLEISA
jgi:hypothetical protein